MRSHPVVAPVVLAALTLGVAACGSESEPTAPRRDAVVAGTATDLTGARATAVVPTGSVEVTVGEPVPRLTASQARDAKAHRPPTGSSYLPVHLSHDVSAAPWAGLLAASPRETTVTLEVDGLSTPLGAPYRTDGTAIAQATETTFYVPVPQSTSTADVAVRVEYDGAAQTLDPAAGTASGPGSALAELAGTQPPPVACPDEGWSTEPAARATVACEISWAGRTPYWPGAGWSETGAWQVARVARLQPAELGPPTGDATWEVERVVDASTAAGAAPARPLETAGAPDTLVGTLVFPATPGTPLDVELSLSVTGTDTTAGTPRAVGTRLSLTRRLR